MLVSNQKFNGVRRRLQAACGAVVGAVLRGDVGSAGYLFTCECEIVSATSACSHCNVLVASQVGADCVADVEE